MRRASYHLPKVWNSETWQLHLGHHLFLRVTQCGEMTANGSETGCWCMLVLLGRRGWSCFSCYRLECRLVFPCPIWDRAHHYLLLL